MTAYDNMINGFGESENSGLAFVGWGGGGNFNIYPKLNKLINYYIMIECK